MKNRVRPIKHWLVGKDGIYKVMDEVAALHGGANNVATIFDVGAATGEYTLHFLKHFPNARIHCFEPQPDSFKKLAERTKPYASRVQLYNYGLYDHAGPATFHVSAYRDASSLLDKGVGDTTDITVALMRLDDVVASDSVEKIDFMKIDTEGAELGVIKGGPMAFKDKILSAYIEIQPQFKGYYSSAHIELFQSLHDFGFGFAGVFGDDYFFSKLLPRSKNN